MGVLGTVFDTFTSKVSDKNVEALQDSVKSLNHELTLLRYENSDDEDIRTPWRDPSISGTRQQVAK